MPYGGIMLACIFSLLEQAAITEWLLQAVTARLLPSACSQLTFLT